MIVAEELTKDYANSRAVEPAPVGVDGDAESSRRRFGSVARAAALRVRSRTPTSRRVTVRRPAGAVVRCLRAACRRDPRPRLSGTGRCRLRSRGGFSSGRGEAPRPPACERSLRERSDRARGAARVPRPRRAARIEKQWAELMRDAETSLWTQSPSCSMPSGTASCEGSQSPASGSCSWPQAGARPCSPSPLPRR